MDVLEAIEARKSIRAFKPDPVPQETVHKILEISQRSPSGTNTQPWHVYVCAGDIKQAITDDVLKLAIVVAASACCVNAFETLLAEAAGNANEVQVMVFGKLRVMWRITNKNN